MVVTSFYHSHQAIGFCQCWRPEVNNCGPDEDDRSYFETDIDDIANSLMRVMCICRLRPWEVKLTKDVIKRSFRHYEELRYRVDRVPRKRFNKENFLHDVGVEAGMNRMDGQLAYGITKRAFRAYFHGTGENGLRVQALAEQLKHREECMWLHAAKRTAEIFAAYAGLMYSEQMQYEKCIECVYKALYEELLSRFRYVDTCNCNPPEKSQSTVGDEKKAVHKAALDGLPNNTINTTSTAITTELFFNKLSMDVSKATSGSSMRAEYYVVAQAESVRSFGERRLREAQISKTTSSKGASERKRKKQKLVKCDCRQMVCGLERLSPVITAECSQGPYICRWLPYNEKEEQFLEHRVPCPPMDVLCPPCEHEERSCDEECTCTCQLCRCPFAYGEDDVEEEHAEKLSNSGVEDRDTDYCWLAPLRDFPRSETVSESSEATVEQEEEEDIVDPDACVCMCEYKRRSQPHLFTYLAPFKDEKSIPVVEEPVETVKRQGPPCGISWATYRCWNEPTNPADEQQLARQCRECPYISLLSAPQNVPQNPPKVAGITLDITVKTQHYPSPQSQRQSKVKSSKAGRSSVIVKRNTIAGLEMDMKTLENQKPNQPAAKSTPPATAAGARVSTAAPKTAATLRPAPAAASVPAAAATRATSQDDDKLTKEDILEMFGLNK
ncbi:uncharacterized protein LOC6569070 [Drosophila grimshawi]|uniref:GH22756 n=1 Tax=Drosophila grimshawi TaxID=7222 RepID=B4JWE0_DROGR|nr:uncharacterized protein LOC6569070 [Drosophila grimshawi]EDV98278.1 GH22756 [Drosophila grimshawi]